jgi:hypothetical protein
VLFAATKADHLHHSSHDRLERLMLTILDRAASRAESGGAKVEALALASIRATREATVSEGRETLDTIIGVPESGENIGDRTFDGTSEVAIYPGELPTEPKAAFSGRLDLGLPRLRPPAIIMGPDGRVPALAHIRLDRALEFLLGDWTGSS